MLSHEAKAAARAALQSLRAGCDGEQPAPAAPVAAGLHPLRRVLSDELLGRDQEIEILHGQALYRLRRTSLGKLILTK
jgi:hemin uptake protein HemP